MPSQERKQKITIVAHNRQHGIVVLEDIHDPHNAAAVLRSCETFGIQRVYFIFVQEEKFDPKKIGQATSSSANCWLDFEIFTSPEDCFAELKKEQYTSVATLLDKRATSLFQVELTEPKIAWIFGNEHRGLSPAAAQLSDRQVYIPMRGFVQSLNVSVTAGICLWEMTRQRHEQNMANFLLPPNETAQLTAQWLADH